MGLTLKITVGVFAGAVAAYLAINAPARIEQARRDGEYEKADRAIRGLTPDLVIQRCGKPQKDVVNRNLGTRLLDYTSVVLLFWQGKDGGWSSWDMYFGPPKTLYGTLYPDGKRIEADPGRDNEAFVQVALLGCLDGSSR